MARTYQPIKIYLSESSSARFKALADKYGITRSALGSLVLIKFLQEKPEEFKQLLLAIDPFELVELED